MLRVDFLDMRRVEKCGILSAVSQNKDLSGIGLILESHMVVQPECWNEIMEIEARYSCRN